MNEKLANEYEDFIRTFSGSANPMTNVEFVCDELVDLRDIEAALKEQLGKLKSNMAVMAAGIILAYSTHSDITGNEVIAAALTIAREFAPWAEVPK